MKTICCLSGVEFEVAGVFKHLHNQGKHPVFDLSSNQLLSLSRDWIEGSMNEQESYLLFLALLHSTDLIDWNCPIRDLKYSTVQGNMELLIKTISWLNAIGSNYMNRKHYVLDQMTQNIIEMPLPRFVINHSTCSLSNVTVWIECWTNTKNDWLDHYKHSSQRTIIQNREEALFRLINNQSANLPIKLAEWAMDAANVPMDWRKPWTDIFKLKGMNLYAHKHIFILECLEHMEEHLPHGTTFAMNVLKHLRSLEVKNRKGLMDELGMNDISIIEDDVESFNKKMIAETAPITQPIEKNYPNKLAYLKAKAAFNIAAGQRQINTALEKQRLLEKQQRTIDFLHETEEAEIGEDINQLSLELRSSQNINNDTNNEEN